MKSNTLIFAAVAAGLLLLVSNNVTASGNGYSNNQLQQTANLETFSPQAHPDGSLNGVQLYSIGYGHQIQPNEQYLLNQTITQAQATQLLAADLQTVAAAINSSGQNLTQGQYDALTDFGYNAGISAMNKVLATLQSSGPDAATAEMAQYIYWHPTPGGAAVVNQDLVNRRNIEIQTFNS